VMVQRFMKLLTNYNTPQSPQYKLNKKTMATKKEFLVKFLHTDGSIRTLKINAFDSERAKLIFQVNWCDKMKLLNITQAKK